ncbi:asparagine synthetase domain-containing protein 1 isoform X1 [Schistocerca serialis cubense]|uniref:asparagine synthetase domain-containing protein 1 isoform X1 n=1 Tax=Schistocerca serialis cubense TaxID=2023355 RepID=UPI00214F3BEA|nr:asparagine synthetase domain-containing protein 1 isoform X1 [Schistocerca serialis cubense]
MCGIYFAVYRGNDVYQCQRSNCDHNQCDGSIYEVHVKDQLESRGPDTTSVVQNYDMDGWAVFSAASVLWMQGKHPTPQPLVDSAGNILLWNGDIFYGSLAPDDSTSDTLSVVENLSKCHNNEMIIQTISKFRGPFSFVYLNPTTRQLWFGRDVLGRHSLLSHSSNNSLVITSVSTRELDCQEVPAVGVFLAEMTDKGSISIKLYPWSGISETRLSAAVNLYHMDLNIDQCFIESPLSGCYMNTDSIPSSVIESYWLKYNSENIPDFFTTLLMDESVCKNVDRLLNLLNFSVKVRCGKQCELCKNCVKQFSSKKRCKHSKVGILFSGGLDSSVIAALASECIPKDEPIDLINVAFEPKKRICRGNKKAAVNRADYNVPDRKTGVQSYRQLQSLYPERKWNFIQVDVTREELKNRCLQRISDLIHPLKTVLDESLGCALWFASRGQGSLLDCDQNMLCSSPSRILLVGMGADEQLGGYRRHRSALRTGGWPALQEMLKSDLDNISSRNLGRDDRVVADHGCQARFPFLDEAVVSFLTSLHPWEKCFPVENCPPGVGDKLLLRLAACKLGLHEIARLPKRAMQFGSKIADSKENGNDVSHILLNGTVQLK